VPVPNGMVVIDGTRMGPVHQGHPCPTPDTRRRESGPSSQPDLLKA
jgi:hypothetical protein